MCPTLLSTSSFACFETDSLLMARLPQLKRASIILQIREGKSDALIARQEGVNRKTVSRYRKRSASDASLGDLPRSGRPRCTSPAEDHKVKTLALSKKTITTAAIAQQIKFTRNTLPSKWTIRRRLRDQGVLLKRPSSKPMLTDSHKKKRLAFARANKDRDWTRVNFADEKSFVLENNKGKIWVERNERPTRATVKHPPKVHVFASFGYYGVGKIHLFEENLDADLLVDILKHKLLPSLSNTNAAPRSTVVFYHDRDPKFTSRKVKKFINENDLTDINAPPQSPDFNPQENLWHLLQSRVEKTWCRNLEVLKKKIRNEWNKIEKSTLENLVNSIPRRMKACIRAKGGPTKY